MSSVNITKIIQLKSEGATLDSEDIKNFVKCVSENTIDDAQIGAFLMAVKLKGMNAMETADLTKAMTNFSYKFDWSNYEWHNKVVDKHSTGGVGDKISHILAPILSACGLKIPMISGRGLGITGGTIDKLESIDGFIPLQNLEEMPRVLENVGFFITGQTETMVPVDKRLYAIRDVTATIDSIPLITASILSKKAIEDIQVLLMDIKYGNGAFMKTENDANELAKCMIETGKSLNMKIICFIDDMNSPLGCCIGNALEIAEVLRALNGAMFSDIEELIFEMGYYLLKFVDRQSNESVFKQRISEAIKSGTALKKFQEMLISQGVNERLATDLCVHQLLSIDDYLQILNQKSLEITQLSTTCEGVVQFIHAEKIGTANQRLGGGRQRKEDKINYRVGIELLCKEGDFVKNKETWAKIHHDGQLPSSIIELLQSAIVIGSERPLQSSRIKKILFSENLL